MATAPATAPVPTPTGNTCYRVTCCASRIDRKDGIGSASDAYVVIKSADDGRTVGRSGVAWNTLDPTWEPFELCLDPPPTLGCPKGTKTAQPGKQAKGEGEVPGTTPGTSQTISGATTTTPTDAAAAAATAPSQLASVNTTGSTASPLASTCGAGTTTKGGAVAPMLDIEVWDWDDTRQDDYIGGFQCSLLEFVTPNVPRPLINPAKVGKLYTNSGTFVVTDAQPVLQSLLSATSWKITLNATELDPMDEATLLADPFFIMVRSEVPPPGETELVPPVDTKAPSVTKAKKGKKTKPLPKTEAVSPGAAEPVPEELEGLTSDEIVIYRSQVQRNTANPAWPQFTLNASILGAIDGWVTLHLYDWDEPQLRHQYMGTCNFPVGALLTKGSASTISNIPVCYRDIDWVSSGTMHVQSVVPSWDPVTPDAAIVEYIIQPTAQKLGGGGVLKNLLKKPSMDPFVILKLPDGSILHQTEVLQNNPNPTFMEFRLPVAKVGGLDIPITWEFHDADPANKKSALIGTVTTSLRHLSFFGNQPVWSIINAAKVSAAADSSTAVYDNSGVLRIQKFEPVLNPALVPAIPLSTPTTPPNLGLTGPEAAFAAESAAIMAVVPGQPPAYQLFCQATKLDSKDGLINRTSDGYIVIKNPLGKVVAKSGVIWVNLSPVWEPFEISTVECNAGATPTPTTPSTPTPATKGKSKVPVTPPSAGGLVVEIWDWDATGRDHFIGIFSCTLSELTTPNVPRTLLNPDKQGRMFYSNSGIFNTVDARPVDRPSLTATSWRITISAENLPNMDNGFLVNADAFFYLVRRDGPSPGAVELIPPTGRKGAPKTTTTKPTPTVPPLLTGLTPDQVVIYKSKVMPSTLCPTWPEFAIDSILMGGNVNGNVTLHVYDWDNVGQSEYIGSCDLTVRELTTTGTAISISPVPPCHRSSGWLSSGTLKITRATPSWERAGTGDNVTEYIVQCEGQKIGGKSGSLFKKVIVNPYLVISRPDGFKLHTTEELVNNLNPIFTEFRLSVSMIGGLDVPVTWQFFDNSSGTASLVGTVTATLREFSFYANHGQWPVIDPSRTSDESDSYINSGILIIKKFDPVLGVPTQAAVSITTPPGSAQPNPQASTSNSSSIYDSSSSSSSHHSPTTPTPTIPSCPSTSTPNTAAPTPANPSISPMSYPGMVPQGTNTPTGLPYGAMPPYAPITMPPYQGYPYPSGLYAGPPYIPPGQPQQPGGVYYPPPPTGGYPPYPPQQYYPPQGY